MRGADVVRHVEGDLERELDEAAEDAIVVPRGLVDKFFHPIFLDGVGVGFLTLIQAAEDFGGFGRVAVVKIVADYFDSVAVDLSGAGIHVEDIALGVADGDSDR